MSTVTVLPARRVHTMEPARPTAEAVAVRDGRILAVGDLADLADLPGAVVDDRYREAVLLPGFVEAHSHLMAGGFWRYPYVGYFGRTDPDGVHWPGCRTIGEVLDRLRAADAELGPGRPLVAWGLDPIYFPGERLVAEHLDRVSAERPIFVLHASVHLASVNSAMLASQGITADTEMAGVVKGPDGRPTGELQEPPAMALVGEIFREMLQAMVADRAIEDLARLARNAGVTTLTELGIFNLDSDDLVARWHRVVDDPDYCARVSVFHNPTSSTVADQVALLEARRAESTDRLRFGHVKVILDGSIQGLTARLRWPHYLDGSNGMWLVPPEQVAALIAPFHRAGLTVHAHCNGDETVDVFCDAVEQVLAEHPRFDHRHTVQHCQLTTPAQYRRMAALGLCANLFSNHLYYWGDQHVADTVGLDRASRMNAAATALAEGVPLSMHSDAPVTPLGPLHVAWCAVNRRTASGRVLGEHERIGAPEALRAVTLGAAHQLKMDDEIGSIAPGKRADLAVLAEDPLTVDPAELCDVEVLGTVLGGRSFEA